MDAEEGPDRAAEGDEDARRRDPGGGDAREPRPAEQDQDRAAERREQAEPGAAGHPRSSDSVSTSSERFRRLSATTRPSPTQTSEAATAITASAKIWPAPLCQWRESAISARLPRVQHQLEREQHDERVAPDEDAERADPEQDRRRARCTRRRWDRPSAPPSVACEPRITPPTAATSRTTEVISKASRWSTRKTRPIQAGVPKSAADLAPRARGSRSPASRRRRRSRRAARPRRRRRRSVCQLGPPDHGVSRRGPTYAITNRNITTTAPA